MIEMKRKIYQDSIMLKVSNQLPSDKADVLYTDDRAACQASARYSHAMEKMTMQGKNRGSVQMTKRGSVPDDQSVKQFNRLRGRRFETANSIRSLRRQKRMELEQDIEKLKKKLRYEENIHRALERAFTRPLGALPRLPPYLSAKTLELLAEVAVLEEEVVRLEEQIVHLRQGLYYEAMCISISRKQLECVDNDDISAVHKLELFNPSCGHQLTSENRYGKKDSCPGNGNLLATVKEQSLDLSSPSSHRRRASGSGCESVNSYYVNENVDSKHHSPIKRSSEDSARQSKAGQTILGSAEIGQGKENQLQCATKIPNTTRASKPRIVSKKVPPPLDIKRTKPPLPLKVQAEHDSGTCNLGSECVQSFSSIDDLQGMDPNKVSEETVKCLVRIFLTLKKQSFPPEENAASVFYQSSLNISPRNFGCNGHLNCKYSDQNAEDARDPYRVCAYSELRDIGPYKCLHSIIAGSIDMNQIQHYSCLLKRLKILVEKLSLADLQGMTHHQKLAFWINVYNVCMMNAFLEHGIPSSPQLMVSFMRKAAINVGGHLLNALTIEHFVLRLPYHSKDAYPKNGKKDTEAAIRSVYGLEWPEPLVTFALSCGSRSSPAVRVYTSANVMAELEAAKKEYLQAAVGVTVKRKLLIPKLLDWYSWDFAKDSEALLNWICLQLPLSLQYLVTECLDTGKKGSISEVIEVMPYEFDFRYLLAEVL